MDSFEIREKFLTFFKNKDHKVIDPASLIPENDPSVLFTTAGMQQFKRFYLEPNEAPGKRVATIQPCLRTSDIDEIGDESHLTFFYMLGNFSFNDYGKKEAIAWAWEFLTEVLKINKERISAAYFKGEDNIPADEESLKILKETIGLPENKIKEEGKKETFWSLGTEGSPAGPTVEFYIDDIEVWNLVFNEYILRNGKYEPAKFKGVDTGMGLERLAAVMQGQTDIFKTDLFWPMIEVLKILSLNYDRDAKSLRIIADHLKAAAFLVSTGLFPSNKDQGYVLRRLIRRVLLLSQWKEEKEIWIPKVIEKIAEIYPDLADKKDNIASIIVEEMQKFQKTLELGKKIIEKLDTLDAKIAFDLYQTYGFPLELSKEYAGLKKIKISDEDFQKEFLKHRELSRTASAGKFKGGLVGQTEQTKKYHTATHLLLAALRRVLGDYIVQKGSNITDERLRFDFSHPEKLTPEQIKQIEDLVNEKIKDGLEVKMEEMSLDEAKKSQALGVFESKYGDKVKVYSIDDPAVSGQVFSKEICGGPHVKNTNELGHFKIIKEESSSAGVRRIKAVLE